MYKVNLEVDFSEIKGLEELPPEAIELLEHLSAIMSKFINRKTYKQKGIFEHWFEESTCCHKIINLVEGGLVDMRDSAVYCTRHIPKGLDDFLFPLGKLFAGY